MDYLWGMRKEDDGVWWRFVYWKDGKSTWEPESHFHSNCAELLAKHPHPAVTVYSDSEWEYSEEDSEKKGKKEKDDDQKKQK